MQINEIEAISYSRNGFLPHVKSPVIWGHKGNCLTPLCYLTKPKSVTVEEWNQFLDGFSFELKKPNNSLT
jgi:hypothetical protein